jgi:hypothetical protein
VTQDSLAVPSARCVAARQTATSGLRRVIWRHDHRYLPGDLVLSLWQPTARSYIMLREGIAGHDRGASRQGRAQVGGHSRG